MTVPSATCQALGVKVLVSPLYKYERGAPKWVERMGEESKRETM